MLPALDEDIVVGDSDIKKLPKISNEYNSGGII
jgi:hypothetical protein